GGKNSLDESFEQRVLNVGVMPAIEIPPLFDEVGDRGKVNYVWEISTGKEVNLTPEYQTLDVISDTSAGFTRRGVQRLLLPGEDAIGAPSNDVRTSLNAGVGDRPPRIDDEDQAARLVTWLRLRPVDALESMNLSWLDINAVEIDQKETIRSRVIGQSDGRADQVFSLPGTSIEDATLNIQVEESGYGYVSWVNSQIATASRHDAVYELDSEAGTISFGDGVRGRIPAVGKRVRVAMMRAGGGTAGNLPSGSLNALQAVDLNGKKFSAKLKVKQSLATDGGKDAESLNAAEKRIPLWLQHRNRAVTANDYRALVAETPGVLAGRVEVLPRFLPQQRKSNIPGVVSVMVLPSKSVVKAPNPRPDRPFIDKVYEYLSARKPLATELYVIGCEYVQLGVSVAFDLRDGYGHDATVNEVKSALRNYLWSLAPLGPNGSGWPLGKSIADRELEVVVSRVDGVEQVNGVNLFVQVNESWKQRTAKKSCDPIEISLKQWQLPELLTVVAVVSETAPEDLSGVPDPYGTTTAGVAVPVVPETC
ncbi:MAG: baseplate J/gp47 family protein, partial [Gammaproteobacteria bacterium]|nr:baseplate J/gp47 family protein [Gammaproteobacteria bacterium]